MTTSRCGQPTKSGNPCKVHSPDTTLPLHLLTNPALKAQIMSLLGNEPCAQHKTELEPGLDNMRKFINSIIIDAHHAGAQDEKKRVLAEGAPAPISKPERKARWYTNRGDQIVEVEGYAFSWKTSSGEAPLSLGDHVETVPRYPGGPNSSGVVTRIGTNYEGALSHITNVRKRASAYL